LRDVRCLVANGGKRTSCGQRNLVEIDPQRKSATCQNSHTIRLPGVFQFPVWTARLPQNDHVGVGMTRREFIGPTGTSVVTQADFVR
jgi:hypothetical protein